MLLPQPRCKMAEKILCRTMLFAAVLLFVQIGLTGSVGHQKQSASNVRIWAVEVEGGSQVADAVASKYGVRNVGQIGGLPNFYNFVSFQSSELSKRDFPEEHNSTVTKLLGRDRRVAWVTEQEKLERVQRAFFDEKLLHQLRARQIDKLEVRMQSEFNDPYWSQQWYMNALAERAVNLAALLKIETVWSQGITGRGSVVTVVDDGLEWKHSDLRDNYDELASVDLNGFDNDPTPNYDSVISKHGTRCAGEIAMVANNSKCGVGVAYAAKLGGIRMLDGFLSDSLEAAALSHQLQHVHIYSCSWGPPDNGRAMQKPGLLTSKAIETGVRQGRGAKGVLYVFAAGNGETFGDNCNCDGYVSSAYVFAVGAVAQSLTKPTYSERCPAIMVAAYSSGRGDEQQVVGTDLRDHCTSQHTGTSAAAPLVAGIFALLLQKNSNVTWRDVKHMLAWTAQYEPLRSNEGWYRNGAGFWVNDAFGFGLIDAEALVALADPENWHQVPSESVCIIPAISNDKPASVSWNNSLVVEISSNGCNNSDNEVGYIEHVELQFSMDYTRRGDIEITVKSPSGTETTFMRPRKYDTVEAALNSWTIVSTHNWGESPVGLWTVRVFDQSARNNTGIVQNLAITFRGTKSIPDHVHRLGPTRKYNVQF